MGDAQSPPKKHPKRGGTLRFGTREDTIGLDTHRNIIYFVSTPLTGITGGLVDFDDANVSITSSYSMSVTCAVCCRNI